MTLSGLGASTTQPWISSTLPCSCEVAGTIPNRPDPDSVRSRARPWRQGLPHRRTMDAHRGLWIKCDARSLRLPERVRRRPEEELPLAFSQGIPSRAPKNGAPCHPGRRSAKSAPFTSTATRRLVCTPRQPTRRLRLSPTTPTIPHRRWVGLGWSPVDGWTTAFTLRGSMSSSTPERR
jgi:hypothetical protein